MGRTKPLLAASQCLADQAVRLIVRTQYYKRKIHTDKRNATSLNMTTFGNFTERCFIGYETTIRTKTHLWRRQLQIWLMQTSNEQVTLCSMIDYRKVYKCESYVYWTVHHLDSWIKRDQLDVTCFIISIFKARHVSDVNTSIPRSLRLICWVISWVVLLWFDVCWCYVVVWLGWCGIRMQAEALLQ